MTYIQLISEEVALTCFNLIYCRGAEEGHHGALLRHTHAGDLELSDRGRSYGWDTQPHCQLRWRPSCTGCDPTGRPHRQPSVSSLTRRVPGGT